MNGLRARLLLNIGLQIGAIIITPLSIIMFIVMPGAIIGGGLIVILWWPGEVHPYADEAHAGYTFILGFLIFASLRFTHGWLDSFLQARGQRIQELFAAAHRGTGRTLQQ